MTQNLSPRQIRWRCHRGMLELDMMLIHFFDTCYAELPVKTRENFIKLLDTPDPILWRWFLFPDEADPIYSETVRLIVEQIQAGSKHTDPYESYGL